MKKRTVAYYPYVDSGSQSYTRNMEDILVKGGVKLLPYKHGMKTLLNLIKSRAIFLNWFENEMTFLDRMFLIVARVLGKKIVWTFHNKVPHDSPDYFRDKKRMFFMGKVATHILILSNNSRRELKEVAGEDAVKKTVYMPHINYCDVYKPSAKIKEETELDDRFVFLYFGLVRPYKNLELLIEAFRALPEDTSKLIIAGKPQDAAYAKKINHLCKGCNNIELDLHYIKDQRVYSYMQKADIIVLPYDKKSSMNSGAMIAAFSCKKPVIVPDIAMARDYVGKDYVYMYTYKDAKQHTGQLLGAMQKACINGKQKNKLLGEQAYKEVLADNSVTMVTKALEKIW